VKILATDTIDRRKNLITATSIGLGLGLGLGVMMVPDDSSEASTTAI
jgi:xanthine/uracil permease